MSGATLSDVDPDPSRLPHVAAWLDPVEATPGFVNDLERMPAHAERPI